MKMRPLTLVNEIICRRNNSIFRTPFTNLIIFQKFSYSSTAVRNAFNCTKVARSLITVDGAADSSGSNVSYLQARNWFVVPMWCNLCKEPINGGNEHKGKREHICLEMFFDRIIGSQERIWEPISVMNWTRYLNSIALESIADHYDALYERDRRGEILTLTKYLIDKELVFTGKRFQASVFGKQPVNFWGAVYLFKALFTPLINMFPYADAKQISALTQMTSGLYNLESAFDLVGFQKIIPIGELQRMDKIASHKADAQPDLLFTQKGSFIRSLIGQLRWSVEEDSTLNPHEEIAPHLQFLCQRLINMLIAEIIGIRITEYVARVEGVWREMHAERIVMPPSHFEVPSLPSSNRGIATYYDFKLNHLDYDAMMRTDPKTLDRRPVQFLQDLQRGKR